MSRLLVVGGNGALGRGLVKRFREAKHTVLSLDLTENPEASLNLLTTSSSSTHWPTEVKRINTELSNVTKGIPLDGIFCVAGGWSGGSLSEFEGIESAFQMHNVNVLPSLLTAHLAFNHLAQNQGLCVFTGNHAIPKPAPTATPTLRIWAATVRQNFREQSCFAHSSGSRSRVPEAMYVCDRSVVRHALPLHSNFTRLAGWLEELPLVGDRGFDVALASRRVGLVVRVHPVDR